MRFKPLPNKLRKPFCEKSQNVWETDYEFRFVKLWNGFCNPFQKKIAISFETDYRIRFTILRNGICIPFPINFDFFAYTKNQQKNPKRILKFVSASSYTDSIIRFCKKKKETECVFRFIVLRHGFHNPF